MTAPVLQSRAVERNNHWTPAAAVHLNPPAHTLEAYAHEANAAYSIQATTTLTLTAPIALSTVCEVLDRTVLPPTVLHAVTKTKKLTPEERRIDQRSHLPRDRPQTASLFARREVGRGANR